VSPIDDAVTRDLLLRGLDDWLDVNEVAGVVEALGEVEPDRVRVETVARIRQLLAAGLFEAGDVGTTFVAWNLTAQEAAERIDREWVALDRRPGLGEIGWLSSSASADEIVEQILADA
jgi:hypothetical protein